MSNYVQEEKERIARANAQTAHDFHVIEFSQLCDKKIEEALRQYSQQMQVDVQTTLNGRPCTMSGLISDVKKQIYAALRKAFK